MLYDKNYIEILINFIFTMKKMILLGAAVAMIFSSCNTGSQSLKTEADTLAYAMGVMSIGPFVKANDSTLNVNVLAAGISDFMAGKQKISNEDLDAFLKEYYTVKVPARAKEANAKFMEEVAAGNPNAKKTESGILYEIIAQGEGNPAVTDNVKVLYKGTLKNGKEFDNSYATNDTIEFALNRVIPGWAEGIQLIGKGGKIKLWIPSELGYGEMGAAPAIGPNEPLVFEVDLIDFTPAPVAE